MEYGIPSVSLLIAAVAALSWGHPRVAFWIGSLVLSSVVVPGIQLGFALHLIGRDPPAPDDPLVRNFAVVQALTALLIASPVVHALVSAYSVRNGLFVPIILTAVMLSSFTVKPPCRSSPTPDPTPLE